MPASFESSVICWRKTTRKFRRGSIRCVFTREEAEEVCRFIRGDIPGERLADRFRGAMSPDLDPVRDLQRIGLANQTTMLMSESLEIQDMLRAAMLGRWGVSELEARFRAFDTICSATQERQDAVLEPGPRRKVVLATNVAETSLTIEGISVVVDSGLVREALFDPATVHHDDPVGHRHGFFEDFLLYGFHAQGI